MITQEFFTFFEDLSQNNDRDWFTNNKKRYEQYAKEPFIELIEKVVSALADSEPELSIVPVKQMLFRINKDIRFSKDKRPYKEHLSASISRFGTKNKVYPGHYLQLGAHESFLAGGAYFFEEKEMLLRVRRFIMDNAEEFAQLISDPIFVEKWGDIKGDKNKRLPPEFSEALDYQPLIANTQFYWMTNIDPRAALKPDFIAILRGYFEAAQPLNRFLTEAMYG